LKIYKKLSLTKEISNALTNLKMEFSVKVNGEKLMLKLMTFQDFAKLVVRKKRKN